jgi:hypothetical protein
MAGLHAARSEALEGGIASLIRAGAGSADTVLVSPEAIFARVSDAAAKLDFHGDRQRQ